MRQSIYVPRTLADAIRYYGDPDVALNFVAHLRWGDEPVCPRCGCVESSYLKTRRLWQCKGCDKQFSVKLGTIFEDSALPLTKWLPALWLIVNAKNGISSYELHRALGVTQKSAWFMLHRIRLAMQTGTFGKVGGEVEVDETYIGGKARYMHPDKKERILRGRRGGVTGKVAVMGLLSRDERKGHSKVRAEVLSEGRSRVKRGDAKKFVETNIEVGANLFTDEHKSYIQMRKNFIHHVIDHGTAYAKGKVHINGMENFWSLLKRGIRGTYVSVEPFHLFRYLDEQVFRFNNRKVKDGTRFVDVVRAIVGKRLTYDTLIGADMPECRPC
jgi:transposase-like protein